ncbi:MAG TPA: outer membrane beta-barrel protein [Acidobacteriaceae bacterium]|jgi:hypothetical protein|nr:outer membrane beta-barrel protein [Acidobacteriaceae bacterium]
MPVFQKANKLIALSAFALSATLFHATTMRAATTSADAAAAVSTSADAAPAADVATPEPQAAAPAAAPAPAAPAAPPTWSVGPIAFSGLVDGYYNFNANHPNNPNNPNQNQLRNFDFDANSFSLNMVKLSMSYSPAPVGFQVDLGFGKAFSAFGTGVTSCNQNGGYYNYFTPQCDSQNDMHLEQAYIAWKPTKAKGFEADFGEFVTSASAEVIETMNNPNYSRSLLFTYFAPYYHMGLRTSMPVTKKETVGLQIVNGWNNITDNNEGKTFGLTSLYTATNYNWALNYYVGPENNNTDVGYRNLIDSTFNWTPAKMAKWTGYVNYDYLQNRNSVQNGSGTGYHATNLVHQQGIAGELRYQATGTMALSGRYEYVYDASGVITGFAKASLEEFTVTGEYKMSQGLLARLEYRRDSTDNFFFYKGGAQKAKAQSTLEFGVVAFFGPTH